MAGLFAFPPAGRAQARSFEAAYRSEMCPTFSESFSLNLAMR